MKEQNRFGELPFLYRKLLEYIYCSADGKAFVLPYIKGQIKDVIIWNSVLFPGIFFKPKNIHYLKFTIIIYHRNANTYEVKNFKGWSAIKISNVLIDEGYKYDFFIEYITADCRHYKIKLEPHVVRYLLDPNVHEARLYFKWGNPRRVEIYPLFGHPFSILLFLIKCLLLFLIFFLPC